MSLAAVAERYARALCELAVESGQLEATARQITDLAALYDSSPDLRAVLDNPIVPEATRAAVLDAVVQRLGLGTAARNTVRLLVRRRRLPRHHQFEKGPVAAAYLSNVIVDSPA